MDYEAIQVVLNSIPIEDLEDYLTYTCGELKGCEGGIIDDIINKFKFRCDFYHIIKDNKDESKFKNECLIHFINDKIEEHCIEVKPLSIEEVFSEIN